MIELPEAVTLASQLTTALAGRTVTGALAGATRHKLAWYSGDPAAYGDRLAGRRVQGADCHGGFVELVTDGPALVLHDGVRPRLLGPGEPLPDRHQLLVAFDDGSHLVCTVGMYGGLLLVEPDDEPDRYRAAALAAPSPLGPHFDGGHWARLLAADERLMLKALLAAGQRIPGLGNGVLQDVLWTAELHPRRTVGSLSGEERTTLLTAVRDVLAEMAKLGGRSTERDLHGRPGGYPVVMQRAALDRPCPRCGGTVAKAPLLGGAVYTCGGCQR